MYNSKTSLNRVVMDKTKKFAWQELECFFIHSNFVSENSYFLWTLNNLLNFQECLSFTLTYLFELPPPAPHPRPRSSTNLQEPQARSGSGPCTFPWWLWSSSPLPPPHVSSPSSEAWFPQSNCPNLHRFPKSNPNKNS